MSNNFLDLLKERVIVFDGAMGSNLQSQNLTIEDWGGANFENCSENLLYTKPEAIEKVHVGFLEVGCDVIETNSFGGGEVVLQEFGIADKAYDVNKLAASFAKNLANQYSTKAKPRFVAGSIGPGTKLPTLGHINYVDLKQSYVQQVRGLFDGGIDMFIVETCQDILQTKAALSAIFDFFAEKRLKLPVIAQVTIETFGTMLNGTEISAALTALEPFPIDVIGMNCGTGPKQMADSLKYLCENAPMYVSVLPNAGLPEVKDGKQHYDETPESFAKQVENFAKDFGANIVGGCCGTSFEHLKLVVEMMENVTPKQRNAKLVPSASSIYSQQPYTQDNSFLIVGERVNASGSKKMRDLLEAENWDGLVSLAKEQEREGAHILDVNVDFVGRDGVADMTELVKRLVTNVKIPLMLDSTEWEKMEAGLRLAGGKCLLNSTNYEDGEERFFKVLELAKEFGAGVVIGLIDENGMARTTEDKVKIARRAYQAATEFGIEPHDIFFDPLALPISTGIEEDRRNALATIEAIKIIHEEMPLANNILGVSNISFGLNPAARVVLNSIFLHECVQVGMNSAIVNASKILPLNRFNEHEIEVALDLIYDRRKFEGDICTYDPLGEFTKLFEGKTAKSMKADISNLPIEEKLQRHIIDGEKIGLEDSLQNALEKYEPLDIINTHLLGGMKVVGDLFGSGQMQLPFVLQSAEAMKSAVKFLEPLMEKAESTDKGTMILATVKGDVHDIGKNLVDIILTNNGYRVINLGIKQTIDEILSAYDEHGGDAIGMSGLLVKSTLIMRDNLEIMNERNINVPVVLGGAALNRKYVETDLVPLYKGQLFYARDAFDGLHAMDELTQKDSTTENTEFAEKANVASFGSDEIIQTVADVEDLVGEDAKLGMKAATVNQRKSALDSTHTTKSDVQPAEIIPTAPFYGSKVVEIKDLNKVYDFVNETALFKGQWQYKQGKSSKEDYAKLLETEVYPKYKEIKAKAIREKLLEAKLVYGYFPCRSENNDLIILQDDEKTERMRFTFPRQPLEQRGSKNLCLADYFRGSSDTPVRMSATHEQNAGISDSQGDFALSSDSDKTGNLDTPVRMSAMHEQNADVSESQGDFALSSDSDKSVRVPSVDVVAFQLVTMGRKASEHSAELFKADKYNDYLLFHGLSVEAAEALAEMWHKRIREELGFAGNDAKDLAKLFHQGYQGSRYSFGYPACPNLEDQTKLFELLQPERIDVELSEEFQLHPEQSTSAIIIHHLAAKYFNVE
jgi:5-methyltetrahydrofolate--homocysteine methyltransferase